ncbi:MAG: MEDS domain-containing protein [Terriglobales bacterium]
MGPSPPDRPDFTHIRNGDGSITSVCNRCPLTIARTVDARDLAELEATHICHPEERRLLVRIVHRIYGPAMRGGGLLTRRSGSGSGLSQSAKIELIRAHLFLHPCHGCEKSVEHLSPNDERVCFRCQLSLKRRWQELASSVPLMSRSREIQRCHAVQLYSSDEFFLSRFTRFAEAALRAGDAVVVVATKSHRDAVFHRLVANGLDLAATINQGRYISLDAGDTLSTFMVSNSPDPVRFREAARALIMAAKRAARGRHPHVAACGECAPLLWQQGNPDAAIRLEGLWDEIAKTEDVDVLCGYRGESFRREEGMGVLQRIIAKHSAVHAR